MDNHDQSATSPITSNATESRRNPELEEHYMQMALKVAKSALDVGEVPVGCVIVLNNPDMSSSPEDNGLQLHDSSPGQNAENKDDLSSLSPFILDHPSVIVSHGANQVNATRDATRHAECVAIDRMLTGGLASDRARLPPSVVIKAAHGKVPSGHPLSTSVDGDNEKGDGGGSSDQTHLDKIFADHWVNVPTVRTHWKNSYGWGSGRVYDKSVYSQCDLYVTCEPCIMCAAALARVGIDRVFFGCRNDRFGGCGSLMNLHEPSALPSSAHKGYQIFGGLLESDAIGLLRSFYDRENFHAPDEKRKRKAPVK